MPPDYVLNWLPIEIMGAVGALSAVVWGVTVLRKVWREWLRPLLEGLHDLVADWRGQPARPGVPAQMGVMERLAILEDIAQATAATGAQHAEAIADIRHHVKPNGGASAYDAMMRAVVDLRREVRQILQDNHPDYRLPPTLMDPDQHY